MRGTMMRFPLTLTHILERAGQLFGGVEVVSRLPDMNLHRYTYKDFHRRARALAKSLQAAGLQRGDRVATLMWNHYAHLEAYFGVPAAGCVVHTLNLRLEPSDIAYIVNHAEDRVLIVDDVLMPLYEAFKDQVHLERVIVVPLSGKPVPSGLTDYEEFLAAADSDFEYPDLDEEEAAGMCYTSGTTGRPKGVVYSHRSLVLHSLAEGLVDGLGIGHHDTVLPVVPMFHANAWGLPFTATMVGAKQVFPGPHLAPEALLDLYEREQVTVTAGVPTIWFGVLHALQQQPERWHLVPGLRMAVGGAAAPEAMIRGFDQVGARVIHAWGMTETAPLGTVSYVKRDLQDATEDERYGLRATQGLPAPFVEVRIVQGDVEMPWDGHSMGELQVRGPWVAGGYYHLANGGGQFTTDGWFCTGDVATVSREGYVKITDRIKDLIKSGGEWISSQDMENALMGHPAVAEAAVIGLPHPKWQERPLAAVVLKADVQVTAEDLRTFLAQRFAKWWLPDAFVFIDQIPRTSAGKFLKSRLRARFADWNWDEGEEG